VTGSQEYSSYDAARRIALIYLGILMAVAIILGVLHVFYADVKVGRVSWFNLDKERNIVTWFSGVCFFLIGCAAIVSFYWEQTRNREASAFRLPVLWLGIGFVGLFMSLDEITILHENLFWRETRQVSAQLGGSMKYVTQWQILFAPAIILILGYFGLFFLNRFGISRGLRRSAFIGIGCWLVALFLEGVRGTFKQIGAQWYDVQVFIEEVMEMMGAIFLLGAIVFYTIDIALDFTAERRQNCARAGRFLTKKAVWVLAGLFLFFATSGSTIYYFAKKQATTGAPVPGLFKKALQL